MTDKWILLVEDEKDINESICLYFDLHGFSIDSAANGLEAQEKLKKKEYSLIISDVRMPKMNGIDLLHFVRVQYQHIPVIMISAYSDVPPQDLLRKGAHLFMEKPIDLKKLREVVEQTLN